MRRDCCWLRGRALEAVKCYLDARKCLELLSTGIIGITGRLSTSDTGIEQRVSGEHREHLFHESSFCYSRSSARRSTVRISGTTKRSKSSVSSIKVCERREIVIVVSPAMSCQFYGLKFEINCTGIRLVVARYEVLQLRRKTLWSHSVESIRVGERSAVLLFVRLLFCLSVSRICGGCKFTSMNHFICNINTKERTRKLGSDCSSRITRG